MIRRGSSPALHSAFDGRRGQQRGGLVARHIGIVACSGEGAALCYRTICLEALRP